MCERGGWGAGNTRPENALLRKGFLGELKYSLFADRLTSATETSHKGRKYRTGKALQEENQQQMVLTRAK